MELIFGFFTIRTSTRGEIYGEEQGGQGTGAGHGRCGGKARVTEIPGGRIPPDTPQGGKARVKEIPEEGFAPPEPPTTTFQKIYPPGDFFFNVVVGGSWGDEAPPGISVTRALPPQLDVLTVKNLKFKMSPKGRTDLKI